MWQKQLSENLFCIELNKFCYADDILEITVSQYNNFESDSSKINSLSFPLTTEYTFGKLFPEHFRVSSLQICMIVLGKMHLKFWHFGCSKIELPRDFLSMTREAGGREPGTRLLVSPTNKFNELSILGFIIITVYIVYTACNILGR